MLYLDVPGFTINSNFNYPFDQTFEVLLGTVQRANVFPRRHGRRVVKSWNENSKKQRHRLWSDKELGPE